MDASTVRPAPPPEKDTSEECAGQEYLTAHHDRDVIYSLRTVHQAQTNLVMLADQKANILIGVIAVILTIIFTRLAFLKGISVPYLFSVGLFVGMQVLALFFAMLVIVPKLRYTFTAKSIADVPNPLYFGFYTRFNQSDYVDYVVNNVIDNISAREFLARDMYQVGAVLNRKYAQVRYAYVCSLVGILLMVLSSTVSLWMGIPLTIEAIAG